MSIGTGADYGREKGSDSRRRPTPLYSGDSPPGAHAEGLTNLMRENHWSANPGAGQGRDINSLITRTAGDVGKLAQSTARPKALHSAHQHEPRVSSSEWSSKSKQGKKAQMARHGSGDL